MPPKNRPRLSLDTEPQRAAATFVLTETGTFQKGVFTISANGIQGAPGLRGDFSSLTFENLETLSTLGAGACATVHLARDSASKKLLALKVINVGDQGQRHQMVNEIRLLAQMDHPCLVPLFDAFYNDGHVYLALGYMGGGSLEGLLESYRRLATKEGFSSYGLPEEPSAHVLMQVLCGIEHLHRGGVVHRDLKPANVLLDAHGAVRVADFGLSKQLEMTLGTRRSLATTFVGTAAYMSPERLRGDDYSTASDIWGVGMIALESALGEHPLGNSMSYYDLVNELCAANTKLRLPPERFSSSQREFVATALDGDPAARPACSVLIQHPSLTEHHMCFGSSAPSSQAPGHSVGTAPAEEYAH